MGGIMSAIVIHWVNKAMGYEHTALLLNNLITHQPLYISIYQPITKDGSTNRFASQTFENDRQNNDITDYVVIPTFEDGNKFGLSEGVIAKYWLAIFGFKKIHHHDFIAESQAEEKRMLETRPEENTASAAASEEAKIKVLTDKIGETNALADLSNEFGKFQAHTMFSSKDVLDCTKHIVKLLKKGGLDLYLETKLPNGYIGVSQFIGIAKEAVKNIVAMQGEPTRLKDPKFIKQQTSTWSDRQSFRH
jgi:hypothetical protein